MLNITAYWTVICENSRYDEQQKVTYTYGTTSNTRSFADFFLIWLTLEQGIKIKVMIKCKDVINPLNAELNPICHLLALLGGATIVVVSRLKIFNKTGNVPINVTSNEYYIFWMCFYSLVQQAMRMHHTIICGLTESTNIVPHYLIKGTIFVEKKVIEHEVCVH